MLINNIQYFSLHDGPGIRTTVFVQGCNLRCAWCHNPETCSMRASISYDQAKCINCNACMEVCPVGAQKSIDGKHVFHPEKCIVCRKCLDACCTNALAELGFEIEQDELVARLLRDKRWYDLSGGGVTFSGGEPLLFAFEISLLCETLKKNNVHSAIDTALNVPWENIDCCINYADLFLVDLKIFDPSVHQKYTGVSNVLIKTNLQRLAQTAQVYIRIPVVGGVNDTTQNMRETAEFIVSLGHNVLMTELLAYHDFGVAKARKCGIEQQRFQVPTSEQLDEYVQLFNELGLNACLG